MYIITAMNNPMPNLSLLLELLLFFDDALLVLLYDLRVTKESVACFGSVRGGLILLAHHPLYVTCHGLNALL